MPLSACQVLRATSRSPARFVTGRRFPFLRVQSFSSAAARLSSSRSPPTAAENEESSNTNKDNSKISAPSSFKPALPHSTPASRRSASSSASRSQRNGQSDGLPPVNFPQWFKEQNVTVAGPSSTGDLQVNLSLKSRREEDEPLEITIPLFAPYKDIASTDQIFKHTRSEQEAEPYLQELQSAAKRSNHKVQRARSSAARFNPLHLSVIQSKIAAALKYTPHDSEVTKLSPLSHINLVLHCHEDATESLLDTIKYISTDLDTDVVQIDAQNIADLLGDYLGNGTQSAFVSEVRDLGYSAYAPSPVIIRPAIKESSPEEDEEDDDEHEETEPERGRVPGHLQAFSSLLQSSLARSSSIGSLPFHKIGVAVVDHPQSPAPRPDNRRAARETSYESMKTTEWINRLIDFPKTLQPSSKGFQEAVAEEKSQPQSSLSDNVSSFFSSRLDNIFDRGEEGSQNSGRGMAVSWDGMFTGPTESRDDSFEAILGLRNRRKIASETLDSRPVVVLIRDVERINRSSAGQRLLSIFTETIQKRRAKGEKIMLIGTSATELNLIGRIGQSFAVIQAANTCKAKTIRIPTRDSPLVESVLESVESLRITAARSNTSQSNYGINMNVRRIQQILRPFGTISEKLVDANNPPQLPHVTRDYERSSESLGNAILTALGIHVIGPLQAQMTASTLNSAMVQLEASTLVTTSSLAGPITGAMSGADSSSDSARTFVKPQAVAGDPSFSFAHSEEPSHDIFGKGEDEPKHERRLASNIIKPEAISTTFSDVHVAPATIDALKTLTSLSLLCPDAFTYGVLAKNKIPGVLLYGPPGTGKTLLAKAMAKETRSKVLEVSGAELSDMYVGEGEKNVKALFSLARKLSPCVVFIDEADAVLGSRSGRETKGHRELINQFLKEWDGMNERSVFIMVATNRPFDLDEAVLRRLPRRILVDLPQKEDREKILQIHLKDEKLDDTISLAGLAEETRLYSGSDLKNLCVAAALACVKEDFGFEKLQKMATLDSQTTSSNSPTESDPVTQKPFPASTTDDHPGAEEAMSQVFATKGSTASSPQDPSLSNTPPFPPPSTPETTRHQIAEIRTRIHQRLLLVSPTPLHPTPWPSNLPSNPTSKPTPPISQPPLTRRLLHRPHFETALKEIGASISEDMSSLAAIRKFDEKYGDRTGGRGRKGKSNWGFGVVDKDAEGRAGERAARVR